MMKFSTLIATSLMATSGLAFADTSTDDYDPALHEPVMTRSSEYLQYAQPDQSEPLSRAEVIADLKLWREVGLSPAYGDGDIEQQVDEQTRFDQYLSLRESEAFEAEVQRVELQHEAQTQRNNDLRD